MRREQVRLEKNGERLLTAYQEGLVTLPQLRQRMPALQKLAQAIKSELQSLAMAAVDEAKYLQLADGLKRDDAYWDLLHKMSQALNYPFDRTT
jgi:hypothetical protein